MYLIVSLNSAHCSDYIKRHLYAVPKSKQQRICRPTHPLLKQKYIGYTNYISLRSKVEEGEFSKRICPSKTGEGLAYK